MLTKKMSFSWKDELILYQNYDCLENLSNLKIIINLKIGFTLNYIKTKIKTIRTN